MVIIRRFWSQILDEAIGTALLHTCFWYRNHPPLVGDVHKEFPELHSGDIHQFYRPIGPVADLWADRDFVEESETANVFDFRFDSPVENPIDSNNRVWARHWQAKGADQGLTVVGVDGIVQFAADWFDDLAGKLNPAGIDVVMMDAPYNHRRTPEGYRPGQLIVGGDFNHQLAVSRQGILDLWTLVRSLQAEGRRVGLVGISYGGWMSLMTGLLARDLEFLIALVPPVNLLRLLREGGAVVRAIRRGLGYGPLDLEYLEEVARAIIPSYWMPQLDPSRITLHCARYDRFVPSYRVQELALKWGTDFVLHHEAHLGVSGGVRIREQIANDIQTRWL